ncbi:hypothetical protein QL285_001640 [Trifolium repens]|nr:hypothetical protein QL285_001640 [Trifolium repens]
MVILGLGNSPDTLCQWNTVVHYALQSYWYTYFPSSYNLYSGLKLRNLLLGHHLPLFQNPPMRYSSDDSSLIALTATLTLEFQSSLQFLNHNTLPTVHNTELIRLSTRRFQRKQSRSKGSVLIGKELF